LTEFDCGNGSVKWTKVFPLFILSPDDEIIFSGLENNSILSSVAMAISDVFAKILGKIGKSWDYLTS